MRSHRHRRYRAAALAVMACAALAAPAAAEPGADYPLPSADRIGDTPADYPGMPGNPSVGKSPDGASDTAGLDLSSVAIGAGGAGVLIVASLGGAGLISRRRVAR
jgi:hypothetical protein